MSWARNCAASVSLLPASSATVSRPGGLSTTTRSASKCTIALFARGPARRPWGRVPRFASASALHEFDRGLEELQVPGVVRGVLAIDLDPFAGARCAAGLEGLDVRARELQVPRDRDRKSYADARPADAGEHPV